uniref:hypothetical protein n=1 Tax=Ningiella ruwaisensis TaxID=2364274 RepID=UPI0010A020D1|nr:hypothetical protein [Ningiella ruwaisensis]
MAKEVNPKQPKVLSKPIRIIIGICALPSIMLAAMLIQLASAGRWDEVGAFEVVYALVGIFATFIALTGRRFF